MFQTIFSLITLFDPCILLHICLLGNFFEARQYQATLLLHGIMAARRKLGFYEDFNENYIFEYDSDILVLSVFNHMKRLQTWIVRIWYLLLGILMIPRKCGILNRLYLI